MGDIGFDGRGVQKKLFTGGGGGVPPSCPPTMGKPVNGGLVFFSEIQK